MPDAAGEWSAAALVVAKLGGLSLIKRDRPGAPDATHDFDIELRDGATVALEITTAAAGPLVALSVEIEREPVWVGPSLSQTWWLSVWWSKRTRVGKLRAEAERHLLTLEQSGPTNGFGDAPPFDEPPVDGIDQGARASSAMLSLQELGVMRCRPHPGDRDEQGRPLVRIAGMQSPPGGFASSINGAVAAAAKNNEKKLATAQAEQKHLFVWADASMHASGVEVLLDPPRSIVELPDCLDMVWLAFPAIGTVSLGVRDLWRARQAQPWQRCQMPPP